MLGLRDFFAEEVDEAAGIGRCAVGSGVRFPLLLLPAGTCGPAVQGLRIGMVIGVGEIDLSNWVRYYMGSQKPILWVLALCFAYFICFSMSLWFWCAGRPSSHPDR